MYTFDRLPFWSAFFASSGTGPSFRRESDRGIRETGVDVTVAEPCFPIRVAHGHVEWLAKHGADLIFLPNQINEETEFPEHQLARLPVGTDAALRGADARRGSSSTPSAS